MMPKNSLKRCIVFLIVGRREWRALRCVLHSVLPLVLLRLLLTMLNFGGDLFAQGFELFAGVLFGLAVFQAHFFDKAAGFVLHAVAPLFAALRPAHQQAALGAGDAHIHQAAFFF